VNQRGWKRELPNWSGHHLYWIRLSRMAEIKCRCKFHRGDKKTGKHRRSGN
jgi:hypothetical protein